MLMKIFSLLERPIHRVEVLIADLLWLVEVHLFISNIEHVHYSLKLGGMEGAHQFQKRRRHFHRNVNSS